METLSLSIAQGSFIDTIWSPVKNLWNNIGDLPGVQPVIIIALTVVCAKLAAWVLTGLVGRWVGKTETTIDDDLIKLMHRPVFMVVLLIGLGMAVVQAGFLGAALGPTLAILKTLGIVFLAVFAIRASNVILEALSRNRDRFPLIQSRTLPLFYNITLLIVIGAALYFLCLAWEINPSAWLASAGIIGLALSFAAKDSLANLFAGAFILADAPYKIGDFILLDSGERGQVTHIGLRSTRMLTRDDVEITVPNAVMGNSKITNESGGPYVKERIRIRVGVAYGTDIDRVEELLLGIAVSHPEITEDPEPKVRFKDFGDSALLVELRGWISEPVLRGRVSHMLRKEIYKCFLAEGIEIPYPKLDVSLQGAEGNQFGKAEE